MRDDRRSFFRRLAGGLLGLSFAGAGRPARAEGGKVAIGLDRLTALAEVGGQARVKLRGREILLVRESQAKVRALEAVCTHAKCFVAYDPEAGRVACPCHGSTFALDSGKALKKPATRPLATFPAILEDRRVIVDLG